MMNNDGPRNIGMRLEARQPQYQDIRPSPENNSDHSDIIVAEQLEPSSAESQLEPTEAAHTSGGQASRSPHATTTAAPVVIDGVTASDISYQPLTDPPDPRQTGVIFDNEPSTVQSAEPTKTTARDSSQAVQATNEPTHPPQSHGRPTATRTVAIVVPIVVVALLLPFLIFWCLSCRRRKRAQRTRLRRQSPPETAVLEKRMQENLARARKEWSPESLFATKNTTDLASPAKLPLRRVQRPRSAQQLRTSDVPNNSLSGFNFDFSRRATTFSKRSTQRPLPDPSNRRSSIGSWEPSSPYPSRSAAFTPPYLPARTPIPHSPPSRINQTDEQFPPGSEASLGLLAREKAEAGSGRHDISPALSLHEERTPYGASNQPLSDAISEISGLSVDHDLWPPGSQSARHLKSRSEVSAMEPYPRPGINPI